MELLQVGSVHVVSRVYILLGTARHSSMAWWGNTFSNILVEFYPKQSLHLLSLSIQSHPYLAHKHLLWESLLQVELSQSVMQWSGHVRLAPRRWQLRLTPIRLSPIMRTRSF